MIIATITALNINTRLFDLRFFNIIYNTMHLEIYFEIKILI